MNGFEIDGRAIEVREDRPVEKSLRAPGQNARTGGRGIRAARTGASAPALTTGLADHSAFKPATSATTVAAMAAATTAPSSTLYVNNLNWNSTDDDLFQHFCTAGVTPTSAKVQMNDTNGRSKGWGLVGFLSVEDAQRAMIQLNKSVLDERKISVRFDAKSA